MWNQVANFNSKTVPGAIGVTDQGPSAPIVLAIDNVQILSNAAEYLIQPTSESKLASTKGNANTADDPGN